MLSIGLQKRAIVLISNNMILSDKVYSKNLRFTFLFSLKTWNKKPQTGNISNVLNSMWLNQIKFFHRTSRFKTVFSNISQILILDSTHVHSCSSGVYTVV